jgi:hypothetical protein
MSLAKLTDSAVAALLDKLFGNTDFTPPATFYIALTSGGTELSGSGYARVAVTNNTTNFANTASRQKLLQQIESFAAATANWSNVDGWALYDASTNGTAWVSGDTADLPILCIGDASADTLTSSSHGLTANQAVRVEAPTGGTLPTGLAASTTYYVINPTTNTFQLSATQGGSAIDLTAAGLAWVALWYGKTGIVQTDVVQFPANTIKIKIS